MKFCIVVQARLGSKRFPRKILKKINKNFNSLTFLIHLIKNANHNLVIATTKSPADNEIVDICKKKNVHYFRGSETNVFMRYKLAAKKFDIKNIIRITSDCPLLDLKLLNKIKIKFIKNNLDYISNTLPIKRSKFPNGSDIEIFKSKLLSKYNSLSKQDKEHVTNIFWKDQNLKKKTFTNNLDYSKLRYTLDYKRDLVVIKKILIYLTKNKKKISFQNISKFLLKNPNIMSLNKESNNIFQGKKISKN